jgi:prophage DNA circulation protein
MAFDITKLNNSSFRGIPFYTREDSISGGLRLTDHSFINGGTRTEPNGLKAKPIKIKAYIGGDDYLAQKKLLIKAFEDITPGVLVDKFNGTQTVLVDTWVFNEKITAFGKAEIDITFKVEENNLVEDFDLVFTTTARDESILNFEQEFNNEIGEELTDLIANDIIEFWNDILDIIKFLEDKKDALQNIKDSIGGIIANIKIAILSIDSLISDIQNIWTSFDDVLDLDLFSPDEQKSFTNVIRNIIEDSSDKIFTNSAQETVNEQSQIYTNTVVVGLTETAIKNLENIEFSTGDDLGSVKDDILTIYTLLEKSIIIEDSSPIDEIIAKQELINKYQIAKREFIEFYTQKYSGLQELKDVEIVATIDILNLTMEKYNDISRVDEVLVNNNIVDPFFINENLKLLDR